MSKTYELNLPVFKKGDDLHYAIGQAEGNLAKAFVGQAECYEEAARLCRKMASVAAETPSLTVYADTHLIQIEGPEELLQTLTKDNILEERNWEDEDEDEGEYEDVGDDDGEI